MPRIRIPSGGWQTLAAPEQQQPAHLTRLDGSVVDLDAMLERVKRGDFDRAPTHRSGARNRADYLKEHREREKARYWREKDVA